MTHITHTRWNRYIKVSLAKIWQTDKLYSQKVHGEYLWNSWDFWNSRRPPVAIVNSCKLPHILRGVGYQSWFVAFSSSCNFQICVAQHAIAKLWINIAGTKIQDVCQRHNLWNDENERLLEILSHTVVLHANFVIGKTISYEKHIFISEVNLPNSLGFATALILYKIIL